MVTEVLGFSLILPFLPLYAQDLGADPFTIGMIVASFSFFQFFSAPVMGKLSDYFGRKPLLIISQISTFASFVILGFANSLWMIFLSRIIDGLIGSNQTIAQAYLSDISSKENRSKAFGISGMAFGLAFLFGPAIGGFLSQFGYAVPAFAAAGISMITILATVLFLPETRKTGKTQISEKPSINIINSQDFIKYFSNPKTRVLLIAFGAYVLSLFVFTTNLSLFCERRLGYGASQVGFLLAYVGVINLVLRSPILGKLIDWIGEQRLMIGGVVSMAAGLFLMGIVKSESVFYLVFTLFAVGSAFSRPLITGELSRRVSDDEQGAISGITGSLGSLARIFAPLIGGYVLGNFFAGSLPITSSIFMIMGLLSVIVNCIWARSSEMECSL